LVGRLRWAPRLGGVETAGGKLKATTRSIHAWLDARGGHSPVANTCWTL
jgi:hypothetical protein